MAEIILTTFNAKYAHCAFGLRYLLANLGELQPRAQLLEFDINQRPLDVAETILRHEPRIVGLGVYIWNAVPSLSLVADLKRLRPDLIIVIGGPEVSYETEQQEISRLADFVITGEGDLAFAALCRQLLDGETPPPKILTAPLPTFDQLALPYDLYSATDIAHRVIYVEASRGCPFECEFCLSALDVPVRAAPLGAMLAALQSLLDRGVRQFKFVDRTFNLNIATSRAILEFFRERWQPGLFLHFEMIPDRFPDPLRELIQQFPAGALQFEVGVQTFNETVAKLISRRQDNAKVETNLRFLREQTGVHVHADLIVGLPGEDLENFAAGFDRLVGLRPHEIQVGLLKRLRGTPIIRHDREWAMVYSPQPPYEILQTKLMDFFTMQRLRRFARYWDLIANSGNFVESTPLLWQESGARVSLASGSGMGNRADETSAPRSPFWSFLKFSDWLFERTRQTHAIALARLAGLLAEFLATDEAAAAVARDTERARGRAKQSAAPARQARHMAL